MNHLETSSSSSSASAKRLESLPILSLARRSSKSSPSKSGRSVAAVVTMPSSASSSSSSSSSSSASASTGANKDTEPKSVPPLPVIHHQCTYIGDAGKEFDDVVFDILKVDPDDIAVSPKSHRFNSRLLFKCLVYRVNLRLLMCHCSKPFSRTN